MDNFLAAFLPPTLSLAWNDTERRWSVLEIGLINVAALNAPLTALSVTITEQEKKKRRRKEGTREIYRG